MRPYKPPPITYSFKDVEEGKRSFLYEWLDLHNSWQAYSKILKGPFLDCVTYLDLLSKEVYLAHLS